MDILVPKMRFVDCDICPCLNNDYEGGCSCNLGYVTDYVLVRDEPQVFMNISPNCELVEIRHYGGIIKPDTTDQRPLVIDQNWREMAEANAKIF